MSRFDKNNDGKIDKSEVIFSSGKLIKK